VAWRFRNVEPEVGEAMANKLVDALGGMLDESRAAVLRGKKVVEVRPAGVNKGAARLLVEGPLLVDSGVRGLDAERLGGLGAEAYGRGGVRVSRRHRDKEGVSEAVLELPGYGERRTPVVPGESEDLLGAVTLEIFGPVLDPSEGSYGPLGR